MKNLIILLFCNLLFCSLIACDLDYAELESDPASPNITPNITPNAHSVLLPKIIAGSWHTCAIRDDGKLKCWGNNAFGETTGSNKKATGMVTVDLGANHKATGITAGSNHTCSVLDSGAVKCWGGNYRGETGNINYLDTGMVTVDLGTDRRVKEVTAGEHHTCALLDDGKIKCWGNNAFGETGGSDKQAKGIVNVNLGPNTAKAKKMDAGWTHTCVLLEDNTVKCWGYNKSNQTGGSDKNATGIVTVNLGSSHKVKDLAMGGYHSCVLLDNGTVKCWGSNEYDQTGGSNKKATGMVTVNLGSDSAVIAISAGRTHTCALLDDDTVKCWGDNEYGQTGGSNKKATGMMTVNLGSDSAVIAISAGRSHTCALLDTEEVKCWGLNSHNQTGSSDKKATGIADVNF